MKVKVVSVEEKGFDGKDGRVAGALLTFREGDKPATELIGYGPAMVEVLKWQPGEEKEIEVFRPEGKDRDRFRLPKGNGGGSRGGGQAAYANTAEGLAYEQERMDRRTAIMQAVAMRSEGKEHLLLDNADKIYDWLRKTANGK